MGLLQDAGIRLRFFSINSDEEEWQEELGTAEEDFLVWAPLWSREAFDFHAAYPEIPGILLFPGVGELPLDGAGALTVLRPKRRTGWEELAGILQTMDYDHVSGVFSSATNQRGEAARPLFEKVNIRRKTIQGRRGLKAGQKFLEDELSRGADFIILAAGGANAELYGAVKNLSTPLFIEAPFSGYQSRENIKGTFLIPWHEEILTLAALPYDEWPTVAEVQVELIWRDEFPPSEEAEPQQNEG